MIAGVATDTIVVSTRIMKNPMHRAKRAGQGCTPAGGPSAPGTALGGVRGWVVWAMSLVNTSAPTILPGGKPHFSAASANVRDNGRSRLSGGTHARTRRR